MKTKMDLHCIVTRLLRQWCRNLVSTNTSRSLEGYIQLNAILPVQTADSLFLATISAFSVPVSPGEPIVWDSAPINPGGHFNTILGMYTAPVTGYYQ